MRLDIVWYVFTAVISTWHWDSVSKIKSPNASAPTCVNTLNVLPIFAAAAAILIGAPPQCLVKAQTSFNNTLVS